MLSETTIAKCKEIFAQYGIPQFLVSDNGRTFTSTVFQNFLQENGIIHKLTAPFHPATNGQAERYVQTIKNALSKIDNSVNLQSALQDILLQYRITPHSGTGVSPAELLFGRKIRYSNQQKNSITFALGEEVAVRNYVGKEKWFFGTISKQIGKLHYSIKLKDGRIWRRHVNQMRAIGYHAMDCDTYAFTNDYAAPVPSSIKNKIVSPLRNGKPSTNPKIIHKIASHVSDSPKKNAMRISPRKESTPTTPRRSTHKVIKRQRFYTNVSSSPNKKFKTELSNDNKESLQINSEYIAKEIPSSKPKIRSNELEQTFLDMSIKIIIIWVSPNCQQQILLLLNS
ncbi:uncharacterized protein [Cardiocondyla obscurior]|uniref:uncharacterized protein n=1 Tax=Cardiocondyla obscurior TaxID=286306 RepID=UPI003965615D